MSKKKKKKKKKKSMMTNLVHHRYHDGIYDQTKVRALVVNMMFRR